MTFDSWDGHGLPPAANARIGRARSGGVRTSLLSANGPAALETAGFDVAGEVLGAAVVQATWSRYHGCGLVVGSGSSRPGLTVADGWVGYEPYTQAVRSGWQKALDRMRREAEGLGADGVIGVRLTEERLEGEKREFVALGTAVRSRGRHRGRGRGRADVGRPVARAPAGSGRPARRPCRGVSPDRQRDHPVRCRGSDRCQQAHSSAAPGHPGADLAGSESAAVAAARYD